jgi:hypothetical protein
MFSRSSLKQILVSPLPFILVNVSHGSLYPRLNNGLALTPPMG